jgi:hypothetical protein
MGLDRLVVITIVESDDLLRLEPTLRLKLIFIHLNQYKGSDANALMEPTGLLLLCISSHLRAVKYTKFR